MIGVVQDSIDFQELSGDVYYGGGILGLGLEHKANTENDGNKVIPLDQKVDQ